MLIRDTKAKKIETKKLFPSMASNFHKINLLLDFEMFLINSERNKKIKFQKLISTNCIEKIEK